MTETSKYTVLAVDDTESNLDILVDTLGDDYELVVAMDGESALEIAKTERPDLILLDIMMPGMNGYEVCQKLKSDEETKDIPVIFVSAKSHTADQVTGFELGAVDYITKPFSRPIVKARVKNHLALRAAQLKIEELIEQLFQMNKNE